jgi:DNA-directed RNA polymerase alpha subunit
MAVHILNIIPIYLQNSPKKYSARHLTSGCRELKTKDIKTQDVKILTHNTTQHTTSGHHMSMSQHIKSKPRDLSTKTSPHTEVAYRQVRARWQTTKYTQLKVQTTEPM